MKPKKWESVPIRKVYQALYDGPHATPKPASRGPVFLGIKNITEDGKLDLSEVRHIAEEDFPKWIKRVQPTAGDIVFSYEATLHRYMVIPKGFRGCLGRRLALIRPDPNEIDTRFLFHYFFGKEWRRTISAHIVSGATVDRIPLIKFPSFEIVKPPLPIQRSIAAILSAYDDLIENNTRRIQILEEMARRIYEEWFVRFRFPGHEDVAMVESELGLIPNGWEVDTVANAVKRFPSGKKYDQKTVKPSGKVPVLDQGRSGIIGFHDDEPSLLASLDNPVIVFANHTCYQRLIFFPFSAIQNVIPFKSSDKHARNIFWLHYATNGLVTFNDYKGHFPQFAAKRIFIPTDTLAEKFGLLVKPLLSKIYCLSKKNENLRRTRDLLLPKLISGEIDVSNFPEPVID